MKIYNEWYCLKCKKPFEGREWTFAEPDEGCFDQCPKCKNNDTIAVVREEKI